jgi:hypothetical protein
MRRSFFRTTTMRRAIVEGILIFVASRLIALVPVSFWPFWIFPLVLVVRAGLFVLPPVWSAMRVASTRREKMSRRFWQLGPTLAMWCTLADILIALVLGESTLFGGPAGPPDVARFFLHGALHLSPLDVIASAAIRLLLYALYYTIAVVCTRLASGGFLRFTMPAGKGRVTL